MYKIIKTKAYKDQKPGTSGLRKKTRDFMQENYLENFVQAIFNSLEVKENFTLILGGDGRYYNEAALQIILKMAAANGCSKIFVGQHGLLSTPAVSNLIRIKKATGGLIISASHNAAGLEGDFGIKYNIETGSAAPASLTEKFFANSQFIEQYKITEAPDINLAELGVKYLNNMEIHIIDSVTDYADLMEEIFDFALIKQSIAKGLKFKFNAMHAVTGPYALEIFHKRLGVPQENIVNAMPLEDFGGLHPDPLPENLIDFFEEFIGKKASFDLGGACDGDGDRNLIIGRGLMVSPADSLAIILQYSTKLKYYKDKIYGVARSLPTARAVDAVAKKLNIDLYETPTGWKYFGNLLDAKKISICGEESFGTSSFHTREKDGIWAILFWLNILALSEETVKDILTKHWQEHGRCYACRYDYENLKTSIAEDAIQQVRRALPLLEQNNKIKFAQEFDYLDLVDGSHSKAQAIQIMLYNGARIIYRLSGTGTQGAVLRMYIDIIDSDFRYEPKDRLQAYFEIGAKLAGLEDLSPTRIVG